MTNIAPQNQKVLDLLKSEGTLTPMDAFNHGITRLAARVFELKKAGVKIEKNLIKGDGNNYAEYYLA